MKCGNLARFWSFAAGRKISLGNLNSDSRDEASSQIRDIYNLVDGRAPTFGVFLSDAQSNMTFSLLPLRAKFRRKFVG